MSTPTPFCGYCGLPTRSQRQPPVCIGHRDLPQLDPHYLIRRVAALTAAELFDRLTTPPHRVGAHA